MFLKKIKLPFWGAFDLVSFSECCRFLPDGLVIIFGFDTLSPQYGVLGVLKTLIVKRCRKVSGNRKTECYDQREHHDTYVSEEQQHGGDKIYDQDHKNPWEVSETEQHGRPEGFRYGVDKFRLYRENHGADKKYKRYDD